ncbi:interleukin 17-like protein [Gigantopelta aegis]|uniref:interleukin 17-like protein n=1 Tax=Gigantopelta aegis TaxID=1735272 RepID=UPI001B88CE82|nr:interleukin 17-like protein [Gigantopelta aegis]
MKDHQILKVDLLLMLLCTIKDVVFVEGNDATVMCLEPDIDELKQQIPEYLVGSADLHSSFFNVHELTKYIKRNNGYMNSSARWRYVLFGERSCHLVQHSELGQRGNMCPSYYVLEHDPGRIPQDIVHAECTCRSCLFMDEVPKRWGDGDHFECEKIWSHTQVFRRAGCNDGVYTYRYAWERVSVGCACALV